MKRKAAVSILWIFFIIFFSFPTWIMKYIIELPCEGFFKFLQTAIVASSKNIEVLIANIAIAIFIWYDATLINKSQEKHKYMITICALICVIISLCLWILSSFEISLSSVAEFWKSDIFILTLYNILFIVWFYMKFFGSLSKTIIKAEEFFVKPVLGEKIMGLVEIKQ